MAGQHHPGLSRGGPAPGHPLQRSRLEEPGRPRRQSTLDQDYSVNFTTIRPAVVATQPETDTKFVGTRDPIVVYFNQPVDHPSVESGTRITVGDGTSRGAGAGWASDMIVSDRSADSTVYTLNFGTDFPEDTPVRLAVAGSSRGRRRRDAGAGRRLYAGASARARARV